MLLKKLFNNTLTHDELLALRQQFDAASDEELVRLLENDNVGLPHNDIDRGNDDSFKSHHPVTDEMLERMKARIDAVIGSVKEPAEVKRRPAVSIFQKIAAALLPVSIAVIGWLVYSTVGNRDTGDGLCRIETSMGESSTVVLSDGTVVTLYGHSALSFPSLMNGDVRRVFFSGEAYFNVAKDSDREFLVVTPTIDVTVHGTEFNLLARDHGRYTELSLDDGCVTFNINGEQEQITITSRQRLLHDTSTGKFEIEAMECDGTSRRASCDLVFSSASPQYVIDRIEQNYDTVMPSVQAAAINEEFSGTLPADNYDEAVRILARVYGF